MATQRIYPHVASATLAIALPKLARFLINDLGGYTGTSWTIIDTYSQAAGTPHEVPGTPTNMDSLAADNGWRTGTILVDDYIILESASATNKTQFGFEYQAADVWRIIVAPKKGWDIAEDDNDMAAAGNWTQAKLTTCDVGTFSGNGNGNYILRADEDCFYFEYDDGTGFVHYYGGKYDSVYLNDDYPVISMKSAATSQVYGQSGNGILANTFVRLSKVDDTTVEDVYGGTYYFGAFGDPSSKTDFFSRDSESLYYTLMPIGIASGLTNNLGFFGTLRGVWSVNAKVVNFGVGLATLQTKTYAAFCGSAGQGAIAIGWDGTTAL